MSAFSGNLPLIITVATGVFGVVLGALLRPVAEEWFARRRKTVHISLDSQHQVKTPHDSVKFEWRDHKITNLVVRTFKIQNRTTRTIRNLEIEFSFGKKPSDNDFVYISLTESSGGKFDGEIREGEYTSYKLNYLNPKTSISGSVISSYASSFSAQTMDDYEIKLVGSRNANVGNLLGQASAALTFAALASVLAAALSAALG